MKRFLLLFLSVALLLASCEKSDNDEENSDQVIINNTVYPTVKIGNKTWTAANYNGPGGSAYYGSSVNDPVYGKLYLLQEALDAARTLPYRWRLPKEKDYEDLMIATGSATSSTDYGISLEYEASNLIRSRSGWLTLNGNDATGFSAYPAGYSNSKESYYRGKGYDAYFWTSSVDNTNKRPLIFRVHTPYVADLSDNSYYSEIEADTEPGYTRYSIRFVRDNY